jgi:hypothetical protein
MKRAWLGLILAALSCAEPTATFQRPAESATLEPRLRGYSYYISPVDLTVYVRFNTVRDEGGKPVHAFIRRMFENADSAGARRLVIDLRSVAGGDARLLVPLIKGVATRDRFVRPGGLYVVVGPNSFSPAQNAATLLQQYASPIFVRGGLSH